MNKTSAWSFVLFSLLFCFFVCCFDYGHAGHIVENAEHVRELLDIMENRTQQQLDNYNSTVEKEIEKIYTNVRETEAELESHDKNSVEYEFLQQRLTTLRNQAEDHEEAYREQAQNYKEHLESKLGLIYRLKETFDFLVNRKFQSKGEHCGEDGYECQNGYDCVENVCLESTMSSDNAILWVNGKYGRDCWEYMNPPSDSMLAPSLSSGFYWIQPQENIEPVKVYCDMDQEKEGGGWTLVASFINDDNEHHWSPPARHDNWRNEEPFGSIEKFAESDYKSFLWGQLPANDIMISDETNSWVSYRDILSQKSMQELFLSVEECQTSPFVAPGDYRTDSSSIKLKNNAMLTFYAGDPNNRNTCPLSESRSDSTILAIGGNGCGTMGAGQWYSEREEGQDWNANLKDDMVCLSCNSCENWYGYESVTSVDRSTSKKGFMWIRNRADSTLGTSKENAAKSCNEIKIRSRPERDGVYWINLKPQNEHDNMPVPLFCDMTSDDGGWTLIGQTNVKDHIQNEWLRKNVQPEILRDPHIPSKNWASVNAIYLAVHESNEVRLSNQERERWVKWIMPKNRDMRIWWNHAAGQDVISKSPVERITTRAYNGETSQCFHNAYGIMPLESHGGSYPATHRNERGNTSPDDWCMAVGVAPAESRHDGFTQNQNGFDAPFTESGWPNSNYESTPWISVWLR